VKDGKYLSVLDSVPEFLLPALQHLMADLMAGRAVVKSREYLLAAVTVLQFCLCRHVG
jgi:hypothetical protein